LEQEVDAYVHGSDSNRRSRITWTTFWWIWKSIPTMPR